MGRITIVGTGWSAKQLTLEAVEALTGGARIILHTERCGCAQWLNEKDIAFTSVDSLYEACEDFDEHAYKAADLVLGAAKDTDVVYGVFDIRDRSAQLLAKQNLDGLRVIPGPPLEGALLAYAQGETRVVEASDWEDVHPAARENCLIRELDSRELAAEVKLRLMEVYPEESDVWLLNAGVEPVSLPLYELDRGEVYDHRTCVLVPAQRSIRALERFDFEHLNEIMRLLCGPNGCPWDRVQTHASLRTCMLEEAYEVMDAIDEGDMDHLYDELGDVLMQVVIHAEIARRHGEFDISDVTTAICEKLIRRHTHIFGSDSAEDAEQVLALWSRNKMAERGQHSQTEILRSVTRTLPALLRAVKVLKRSADAGLKDTDIAAVSGRCAGQVSALPGAKDAEIALGDALLSLAGVARLMDVDPEIALNGAVNRLIERFESIEQEIVGNGAAFTDLSEATLRKYWDSVKL